MGQPQARAWTVDCRVVDPETGEPLVDGDGRYVIDENLHMQAFLEAATVSLREGGAFIVTPYRLEQPAGGMAQRLGQQREWVNIALHFEHKFAPPVRRQQPAKPLPELQKQSNSLREQRLANADKQLVQLQEGDEPEAVVPDEGEEQPVTFAEGPSVEEAGLVPRRDPAELMPELG